MKPVFIALWIVVFGFVTGFAAIMVASFTTQTSEFTGRVDLHLKWGGQELTLQPKFENRETNYFDTFSGGPKPRHAVVTFTVPNETSGGQASAPAKPHEIRFTYDRHGQVWDAEIAFPDPTLAGLKIEKSSLDFVGVEAGKHVFRSEIFAGAQLGEATPVD